MCLDIKTLFYYQFAIRQLVRMGTLDLIVCINAALTVVEMDPVAASREFVMKVVKKDGWV